MSGQFVENNHKAFTNGASTIAKYLRVKLTAGALAVAGATDRELGVTSRFLDASVPGDVLLRNQNGTTPMVAAGAIALGAVVYTAADGKINDAQVAGAYRVGIALEAASGDGSIIEVLRDETEAAAMASGSYTAVAADDTAGTLDLVTGLDAVTSFGVQIFRSGVPLYSDQAVSESGGTITVADGAATFVITAGDVINWWAFA